MDKPYWEINQKEENNEYVLNLADAEMGDPNSRWYSAWVKWDGCVHFNRYYNTPIGVDHKDGKDMDYLHICDLDEMIKRLTELRDKAKAYFTEKRGEWPG